MSCPLRIEVASCAGVPVLRLGGPLAFGGDLAAVRDIVAQLARAGHHRLIIDLQAVDAIDSSGISALLDTRRTLGGDTAHVILLHPSRRCRDSLSMFRVAALFDLAGDDRDLPALVGNPGSMPVDKPRQ
jgi:anti-anti-sigma factor